jgi:hypothetical protein
MDRAIIRTLFGDVENNERLRIMVDTALENEGALLNANSNLKPITYFVLGDKNEEYLKKRNVKDIIKISPNPDARPHQEIPIYYNKTYLANEAFKLWGKNIEMLLLDMDVRIYKWPDERMWELYGLKKNNIAKFQGAVRCGYKHDQRVPVNPGDESIKGVERNCLICSCVIYCNDQTMWEEYLNIYEELYQRLKSNVWYYWITRRGTKFPLPAFHDEHTLFFWFDKKFGMKTIAEIVEMVEPHSITKFNQSPPEARAIKKQEDLYFRHKG